MLFVRRMVIHGKTMRPLIASCLAVVGLVFLAMTRLATSLPLAIAGTGLVLFGPLLLPFATFSWTPQNTSFVLLVLPASVWVKVEAAAVEVDRGLEVLPVAEAAGGVPDPLDLRIQALGCRVGDPAAEVGEEVRAVRLEHSRLRQHGRQSRAPRPAAPAAEA